jgi:hypothetical protein
MAGMHAPLVGRTGLMGRALLATLALAPSVLTACGESAVAPPPQPPAPVASAVAPADSAPAPAPSASAAAYKDPTESDGPIRLTPLFGAAGSPPPTFPAATASDLGCLGRATVVGDNAKDYPAVVSACGAPTGLAEYTKPVSGMLQSAFDKQDSYVVALAGGYCYRVFATGDQSIFDLGLSITPVAGGKTTEDGARGSVAMLDNDRPLCVDQGGDYAINLAIEGMGYGGYTLGVWARPKQDADAGSPASASARPKKKK